MLASLTILGDTGLELTSTRGDDENSAISLGGTGNHILDEITVTGSVNDLGNRSVHVSRVRRGSGDLAGSTGDTHSDHVLGSLELPKSNVDGDTTFALGF